MIIKESEAVARLNSPMNLMNKLKSLSSNGNGKRQSAMSLFGIGKDKTVEIVKQSFNPFETKTEALQPLAPENTQVTVVIPEQPSTTLDNILENHDSQIKLGLAHDQALSLLNNSIEMLATKLEDVKADKLPSVIAAASKTVESIRRERNEASKNGKDREVHYHFYTPEQKKISDYEVIEVQ